MRTIMRVSTTIEFGNIIRDTRKRSKLTQSQLAAASGTGERFIRELEKGKSTCQWEKALLIAQMLGIKIQVIPPVIDE